MALKVLLADDSMTAQNMGKKILADAGYEVVAVSNGAAAVKKIASEKPDLIVLDVFMPGYTGLEVCERVRKANETAKMPVLLTYGKMEAFDPGEADRVKADGVIVKPFEASDLLAAVEKISQKAAAAAPAPAATPDYETTVKMAVPSFVQDSSYEEWKSTAESHEEEAPAKPRFEMPSEMASAPAFGMEEEPAPAPPTTIPDLRSTVAIEHPAEAAAEAAPPAPEPPPPPVEAAPPPPIEPEIVPPPPPPAPVRHEVEFTSAPKAHEVVVSQEPGLVTDASEMSQFVTKFGVENPEVIPVGVYEPPPEEAAAPPEAAAEAAPVEAVPPAAPEPEPPPPAPAGWAAEEAKVEDHEHAASLEHEMQQAFASAPVEAAPPEPEPPPPPPPAPAAPAVGDETEVLAAEMAAAMAAKVPEPPVAGGTTSLDSATIARIVHAAMEKLKPELEAEIARALAAEQQRTGKP